MIAVFDTNIVIDALNGVAEADAEYSRYERVLISRITWMEVLVGADGDDSELRLPDAIIWATAQVNDAILVTRNTKDFKPAWEGIHLPYTI
jgi:predicted nucleic acid-binding protein